MGEHATRDYAASSAPRRFLAQSKMGAVFLMVGDVLGKKPLQVPLVESNQRRVKPLGGAALKHCEKQSRRWNPASAPEVANKADLATHPKSP
jgi:hypothetical protein